MAKRTLQSCWKQYEKLVGKYLNDPSDKNYDAVLDLTEKANADGLGDSLFALFVKPHLPLDLTVVFDCCLEDDGSLPQWKTFYSSEKQQIMLHPITSMKYILELGGI